MKFIQLTKGTKSPVSDYDYERFSIFNWHLDSSGYACRWIWNGQRQRKIYLHREILGLPRDPDGRVPDHIDRDRLNNMPGNLRILGNGNENQWNRAKYRNNTSGFKCVFPMKDGRWMVRVMAARKYHYSGRFTNIIEAANAADDLMWEFHGELANPNFPIIYG